MSNIDASTAAYVATLGALTGIADVLERTHGERRARSLRAHLEYLETRPWALHTPQHVYEAAEAMHFAFGKFVEELERNASTLGLVTEKG